MLKKLTMIFFLIIIISPTLHVHAIDFEVEKVYKSVVVIYSGRYMGSGFAIGEDCIITNAHVIGDEMDVSVRVYQDRIYKAQVIEIDRSMDLAVIKITDVTLPYLKISDESTIAIGNDVYAIGAPEDMEYTLTKGILSAKNRIMGGYTYLQTDAPINEGNSGGPLLSIKGEVIGVNTMKMQDAEGLGLAIPITRVMEFLKERDIIIDENGETNLQAGERAEKTPKDDTGITNLKDIEIAELKNEVFNLKITVFILTALLFAVIIILVLTKIKYNNKKNKPDTSNIPDFEIDIEE